MSLSAPTPPLLLTKRLTTFLHTNLTPQIHTTLLTTLSGKLLAHASAHPVGVLRTQCTVAASLWTLYSAPVVSSAISDALPPQSASSIRHDSTTSAITIQLTGAVAVIRRLRCGLLFVCLGPAADAGTGADHQGHTHGRPVQTPHSTIDSQPDPPLLGSPSEVESVRSLGAATTASIATTASVGASAVVVMRRQAEDLARLLNEKLGTLGVPEESAVNYG